ncbi:SH3 domain-containing protein [Pseudooceanicola atlanticus]|uniref:SH3b domain-containing protein n=1 Tax=Pseudooceanicola atlanticus TaxID=1461694 RepID=A0A0A0EHH9_9RHOB|nr:SH3 domain-containing protein [Pseudooceanicola atlanticus]KGM49834.1 hypothetical protein ATO9_07440 [Pseudooceanicola atlanticus]
MIRGLVLGLLLVFSGPVLAQPTLLPALHDVTGVAGDDVLNIREAPDAGSPIIGTLAPDAKGIEVIATNDTETWGLINTEERAGWVSLAYLTVQPGQDFGDFPAVSTCFGTEPFWFAKREANDGDPYWVYESPDGPGMSLSEDWRDNAGGRPDRFGLILGEGETSGHAVIARASCNDGMSDREYGLTIDLILQGEGGDQDGSPRLLSGCCRLAQ